jgi:hypothetical protein
VRLAAVIDRNRGERSQPSAIPVLRAKIRLATNQMVSLSTTSLARPSTFLHLVGVGTNAIFLRRVQRGMLQVARWHQYSVA